MCIAILNKSGTLSQEALRNCWESNPDGAGMLYTEKGELKVHKELKNFPKFYKAYATARKRVPESTFLVHFRIGTQGLKDLNNCHPFLVNPRLGFIHNGMLNSMPHDMKLSDTYIFNKILGLCKSGSEVTPEFTLLLKTIAGASNKLVFLNSKNNHLIINEHAGHWDKEKNNWYSNKSYESFHERWNLGYGYSGSVSKGRSVITSKSCDMCGTYGQTSLFENLNICTTCDNIMEKYQVMN